MKFTTSDIFTPALWRGSMERATLLAMGKVKPHFRRTFIREWRKSEDLTLEQLAERLGMTASHLSMLERGLRGYTQETLEAIADALGTDPASLLMRSPTDGGDIWSVWGQAKPGRRKQLLEVLKTLIRTEPSSE